MQNLKKILNLLTPHERVRALFLLSMISIMALLDVIGVASILPFTAVLTNPNLIETNSSLNFLFNLSKNIGVENNNQFLFALGLLVFVLLIISLTFKALTTYFQARFIEMREYSINERLLSYYLHQPYEWFLNKNYSELEKNILSDTQQIVTHGIRPLIELISKGLVSIALIVLLVLINPVIAFLIGIFLGGAYFLIFYFLNNFLSQIGKKRLVNNQLRFSAINEVFGAIKEVKFGNFESEYLKIFSKSARTYALTQASLQVISQLPRFFLEIIAFGGILLIVIYLLAKDGDISSTLPIISLYVFAGYRLIPALQQIYTSLTQLTFIEPTLNKINFDLRNINFKNFTQGKKTIHLKKMISLKNIHYSYPNSSHEILKNISMNILVKSTIGLIGSTGSGKTTLVNIIMGLLKSKKGTLEIDGEIINNQNLSAWQRSIGYVPQNIYLANKTISENIAFGLSLDDIDQSAVERAAKIAKIHSFVLEELPKQYQEKIGDRGIKLSGGQRQRIAIARAIYHNPQILIFDEATSALDNETEQAITDSLNSLKTKTTIIMIAHRLNTLKQCDIIYKVSKGKALEQVKHGDL